MIIAGPSGVIILICKKSNILLHSYIPNTCCYNIINGIRFVFLDIESIKKYEFLCVVIFDRNRDVTI